MIAVTFDPISVRSAAEHVAEVVTGRRDRRNFKGLMDRLASRQRALAREMVFGWHGRLRGTPGS